MADVSTRSERDRPPLRHRIVRDDNRPPACTIYEPADDSIDRMCRWITASGDSFVSLDSIR